MNLPNKLTMARIACTIVMIVFLLLPGKTFAWLSFLLFGAAALTDAADGRIARKRGLVTNFGKFMDPLADKILNYSVMILLLPEGLIPPVALVIILFREFLVSGIRQSGAEQGVVIAANIWGKLKTLFQDLSLTAILILRAVGVAFLPVLAHWLLWICAALTVISGGIYLVRNLSVLKEK
ncbi:MAG: CDP-diacylglycerol--glycerol-3-phosphate 3-phosphatidyltransferase [Oscillospiraceae bacterium]|nr:CDP-diacylglycerol--glycerol-3-phosphate 3-phosphatidyltransferase [Oscillospiraceae bacterium]